METRDRGVEGNSAAWYLELVNSDETPEAPSPLDPRVGVPSTDDQGTASTAAQSTTRETQPDALDGWSPAALSKPMARRRNFRLSVFIAITAVVAVVVAAVVLLPRLVERQATNETTNYRSALVALRTELPGTQSVLATATEPDTGRQALTALVPDLIELDVAADEVRMLATEPLPDALPGLPTDPLDDLEPTREAMRRLGAEGTAVSGRIKAAITYRMLLPGILQVPDPPTTATTAEVQELGAGLASALADTTGVLRELPEDPAFATHREAIRAAVDRFAEWQLEYLAALRADDEAEAEALVAELAELREGITRSIVPALATLRREVDQAILALDEDAADALANLPD